MTYRCVRAAATLNVGLTPQEGAVRHTEAVKEQGVEGPRFNVHKETRPQEKGQSCLNSCLMFSGPRVQEIPRAIMKS